MDGRGGLWVASLPGAFGRVTLFGAGPLSLATAGLLVIGLLKTPLRWSGFALAALAVAWAACTPVPDVLIAADGRTFSVRGPDGRLAFHHSGGDTFAIREWLAADADGRDVHDRGLGEGIACDPTGCVGKLADGRFVAYALEPDAFADGCRQAAVVIAVHDEPPADCHAQVIGRALWRARGALTLRREGADFVLESARSKNFDRPWAPATASAARTSPADTAGSIEDGIKPRARSDDATPGPHDIEAEE